MANTYGKNTESKPGGEGVCINDYFQCYREVRWHYYIALNYYFDVMNSVPSSLNFLSSLTRYLQPGNSLSS